MKNPKKNMKNRETTKKNQKKVKNEGIAIWKTMNNTKENHEKARTH